MKKNKIIYVFLFFGIAIPVLGFLFQNKKPVHIGAVLYDPCGGCTADKSGCRPCDAVDALSLKILETLEREGLREKAEFVVENLRSSQVEIRTRELCEKFGLSYEKLEFPLIIVDERETYQGANAVEQMAAAVKKKSASPGAFFSDVLKRNRKKDAVIKLAFNPDDMIYFYSPLCEDCKRISPLLDEAVLKQKRIHLVYNDIMDDAGYELFSQYQEAYAGPGAQLNVPLVVWKNKLFSGSSEIASLLETL